MKPMECTSKAVIHHFGCASKNHLPFICKATLNYSTFKTEPVLEHRILLEKVMISQFFFNVAQFKSIQR